MNLQLQDHKPLLENQPALPAQVADSMQDILGSLQVTPGDSKESVLEAGQPFHCSTVCLVGACACQAQARVRMAVKQMLGEKVEESLKKKARLQQNPLPRAKQRKPLLPTPRQRALRRLLQSCSAALRSQSLMRAKPFSPALRAQSLQTCPNRLRAAAQKKQGGAR